MGYNAHCYRNWVRHVQLKAVLSTFLKNWHQTGKQNARDILLSLPESWFNVGMLFAHHSWTIY